MPTQVLPTTSSVQIAGQPTVLPTPAGLPGPPGLSAYQLALVNGFVGTEAQWLASLSGAPPRYTHMQPMAAMVWTVNHNFGFVPHIVAFSAGSVALPLVAIANPTLNQSTLSFNTPTSGFAVCQ